MILLLKATTGTIKRNHRINGFKNHNFKDNLYNGYDPTESDKKPDKIWG